MNTEERALQIKIAQLQSDINIFISLSLGQFAAMGAFLIAGYQLILSGFPSDITKIWIGLLFVIPAIPSGIRAYQNLNKVRLSREELHSIK